jgi:K+-transporting ATPase ATPase C chain
MTGIAQVLFPRQSNGSLIKDQGKVVGSELIGQQFTKPEYFHSRPSAAGKGYDAASSGGSNLGPTSRAFADSVKGRIDDVVKQNPNLIKGRISADMVTASGSGLDPDISAANAYAQAPRVAKVRGISASRIRELIDANLTKRDFGILGEPRINVLKINRMLDMMNGSIK